MVSLTHLVISFAVLLASLTPTGWREQPDRPTVVSDFSCSQVTQIPTAECQALVALYNGTGGSNWSSKSGWLTSDTPCTWVGVTCEGGHVTNLELVQNQLDGSIPVEVSNLTYLEILRLDGNRLRGTPPASLADLANLQILDLSGNQLTGGVPAWLGNMSSLEEVRLCCNPLGGTIPSTIGSLTNLRMLDLASTNLVGSLPSTLGNLSNLQYFLLTFNSVGGTLPDNLGNLTSLQFLQLGINQFSGSLPSSLGNLANLRGLDVTGNDLLGPLPNSISSLTQLEFLQVGENRLSGSLPSWLGQLSRLTVLELNRNQFSGQVPTELGGLVLLDRLRLSSNQLIGPLPDSLRNLHPSTFAFEDTAICEPSDAAFQAWLSSIPNLRRTNVLCSTNSTISGRITGSTGNALANVTVSYGIGHLTTTDSDGRYGFTEIPPDTYTIRPSKAGYIFNPPSRAVTVPPSAVNLNFIGLPAEHYLFLPLLAE